MHGSEWRRRRHRRSPAADRGWTAVLRETGRERGGREREAETRITTPRRRQQVGDEDGGGHRVRAGGQGGVWGGLALRGGWRVVTRGRRTATDSGAAGEGGMRVAALSY
jgi:hypothetical protein